MTLKTCRVLSRLMLVALAATCTAAVSQKAYWLFAAAILVGSLVLMALRRRTPEATADERDRQIAGTAASAALQAFAWIGLGAAAFLYAFQDRNPQFASIAGTLTVAAAALMILYELIEMYLRRYQYGKTGIFVAIASLLTIVTTLFALRLIAGEDDWMCQNGRWIMHGHPSIAAPAVPCPSAR
jgi:uncharacterized membrane protein